MTVSYATDFDLLGQVLECYKPHCRYLKTMAVSLVDGQVSGTAELAIGESCYIEDTGHLNAVEVNIAYNQMLYYVVAMAVREKMAPVVSTWTMAEYWRRRLPDILITRLVSRFQWPVDPRAFQGEFTLTNISQRRLTPSSPPLVALDTAFRFWDDRRGRSDGEVTVAIIGS
ncbi:FcoT family thioesterase [Actinocrispum wychmicini]|uniref:(2E)-enoyl-[ACP] glycyltransferase n=1 Tax=Actinocrispum wychmicini TaxID=1213861 RepID=A0A4R2JTR2_9PSEU|nr:FcoT family thioesterase [Actinocrispum wychmicini]TCO60646.1 FcoT-like thioesterase-like protein [Actinocrispum wychmicini]